MHPNIKKVTIQGKTAYQLRIKPTDSPRTLYIKQSYNKEKITQLNNEIIRQGPLTTRELRKYTKRGKHVKQPTLSKYIIQIHNSKGYQYKIQYKGKYYGTYPTLEKAEEIRKKLEDNNWNEEKVTECKHYKLRNKEDMYIVKTKENKYYIRRVINGEYVTFDTGLNSIEEARIARDWWDENGWDFDNVDLY